MEQKFFLYARKSTDVDDKQALSIEAQLTELKAFAKKELPNIIFIPIKTINTGQNLTMYCHIPHPTTPVVFSRRSIPTSTRNTAQE